MSGVFERVKNKKIILVEGLSGVGKSTYIKGITSEVNALAVHGDIVRPSILDTVEQYFQDNKRLLINMILAATEDVIIIDGLIHTTEYDLIGYFKLSQYEIVEYYECLLREINPSCLLIYVCVQNLEKMLDETIAERKEKRKDWLIGIEQFLEHSSLAKQNGWVGESGIKLFLKNIHECNEYIYSRLTINKQRHMRTQT